MERQVPSRTFGMLPLDCKAKNDEFTELLVQYQRELFRFIFYTVHSLPDTEDVLQQSTVAMWEKFDQFQPGTDFLAWAKSIARFKALAFLRTKGRERTCFSEELIEQLAQFVNPPSDMQEVRLVALAQCRQKLSMTDQRLLALCYEGTSIIEAAKVVGRPVGAVYDSLTRIRRALYACIQRCLVSEGYE